MSESTAAPLLPGPDADFRCVLCPPRRNVVITRLAAIATVVISVVALAAVGYPLLEAITVVSACALLAEEISSRLLFSDIHFIRVSTAQAVSVEPSSRFGSPPRRALKVKLL